MGPALGPERWLLLLTMVVELAVVVDGFVRFFVTFVDGAKGEKCGGGGAM